MSGDRDAASASHVAVKLPTFWHKNPRSWFVSVEATFWRAKITQEETRFDHVLAVLPMEVIDTIHSIVDNPGDAPYSTLKEKLLGTYTPSPWQALWQVMDLPSLAADQKPSTLLDTMAALLPVGTKTDSKFFHAIYLRKLPTNIRAPLMAASFNTVEEMAAHADKIWGAQEEQAATHAVSGSNRGSRSPARQSKKVNKGRRSETPGKARLCRYHWRFGEAAERCEPPCPRQPTGNGLAATDDTD